MFCDLRFLLPLSLKFSFGSYLISAKLIESHVLLIFFIGHKWNLEQVLSELDCGFACPISPFKISSFVLAPFHTRDGEGFHVRGHSIFKLGVFHTVLPVTASSTYWNNLRVIWPNIALGYNICIQNFTSCNSFILFGFTIITICICSIS